MLLASLSPRRFTPAESFRQTSFSACKRSRSMNDVAASLSPRCFTPAESFRQTSFSTCKRNRSMNDVTGFFICRRHGSSPNDSAGAQRRGPSEESFRGAVQAKATILRLFLVRRAFVAQFKRRQRFRTLSAEPPSPLQDHIRYHANNDR